MASRSWARPASPPEQPSTRQRRPAGIGEPFLTAMSVRVRVAPSSPVGPRVRGTWRFKETDLLPRREGTSRNGWQPTADALLTMERRRRPVATHGNGSGFSLPFSALHDLPLIATGCNHGAP